MKWDYSKIPDLLQTHQNFLALNRWSRLAEVPHREWVYMMLKCSPLDMSRPARTVIWKIFWALDDFFFTFCCKQNPSQLWHVKDAWDENVLYITTHIIFFIESESNVRRATVFQHTSHFVQCHDLGLRQSDFDGISVEDTDNSLDMLVRKVELGIQRWKRKAELTGKK